VDRADIHPSHEIIADEDSVPDPHNPGWRCTKCGEYACALCSTASDPAADDLIAPCAGILWWDAEDQSSSPETGNSVSIRVRTTHVSLG
jgi:hypothetical protein